MEMLDKISNPTIDQVEQLKLENKKLRREIWSLRAFALCVIFVQLYDLLSKILSK